MEKNEIREACEELTRQTGLPCFDVLEFGADELIRLLKTRLKQAGT
jgi:uncharacterized NAD-dependent epimerase/dehydratase family protein